MQKLEKAIYKMKNKEGISTIEIIIGMIIFLITLCFLCDLLILLWKFSVIAQTTTQVARLTGIQGGANNSKPHAWPGEYVSISSLHGIVEEKFQSAGIASTEWNTSIGGGNIGSGGARGTGEIEYKTVFDVITTVEYRWDFMSNLLPFFEIKQTITAKRPAMSEWKYNTAGWDGE